MTEQKQRTSHSEIKEIFHLANHIIRLTWIILLSLLLTAGVYFKAPWKVTALILIFLFAATILPRAYRKWFWAGVGCVGAAVIVGVFLSEETEGWRPYTFDKELAVLQAKYTIPDEENAAVIYNELLETYDSNSFYGGLPDGDNLSLEEPWLSREHPEISKWLEKHKKTINALLDASKIEKCQFPITSKVAGLGSMIYRWASMKRWAYLLISAANNDMAEGRTKDGLDKYIAVLQLGEHERQQLLTADFLVGADIEELSLNQLNSFIVTGNATEEYLSFAEQTTAKIKYDWSANLLKIIDYEKMQTKNSWGALYAINPKGEVELSCAAPAGNKAQFTEPTYWQKKFDKVENILYWFYMPATPEQAGVIVDEAYEKCYAMTKPDYNWQKKPGEFSINPVRFNCRYTIEMELYSLGTVYYNIHDTYLQTIALLRGNRLIIALRHYKNKNGNWPDSLSDIQSSVPAEIFIDPLNGGSFVYKLTGGSFTLYSKGKNGIDDDGKNNKFSEEETREDDLLIW